MAVAPSSHAVKNRIRRSIFFILLFLVTTLFLGLISDFLMACFWAIILAIIFHGLHSWFKDRLNERDNLSAALTMIVIILVVVIPIALLSIAVVNESRIIYEEIQSGALKPEKLLAQVQRQLPIVEEAFERFGVSRTEFEERLGNFISTLVESAGDLAVRYTQNAITFVIQFTLMLYLLFFFIRDGNEIIQSTKDALPLGDKLEENMFQRFALVARATLKGTVVVAIVQGTLGGLTFWILGIPAAVLWGVIMILLSLLPVGGSAIVWVPAAIILFIQGEILKGIVLILIGSLFIGLIDNLLRPRLVSRDTQMPDYLVLLATLGGLAWFGLSGFIIGPVIASLFLSFWTLTGKLFGETAKLSEEELL